MALETIIGVARQFWVVWLLLLFLGIAVWAFWPKNRDRLEAHGDIPLRDDSEER